MTSTHSLQTVERQHRRRDLVDRKKVRFVSGDTECAAWYYAGTNGACVIMAGGFAVTKEPGTDLLPGASTTPGSPS